ncbi:MAG TPA: hypothetical protein VF170_16135 [Planctomycetaceae bacterium]
MAESDLQKAIREGLAFGDLGATLGRVGDAELRTREDAAAVADLVASRGDLLLRPTGSGRSPLHAVVGLFQQVETQEAFDVLSGRGLPGLRAIFDRLLVEPVPEERRDDLLFLTKILVLYRGGEDVERVAAAARSASLRDGFLWSVIFQGFDEGHPLRGEMLDALRDPLPAGFAGVAYLDFANALAREESIDHPFDAPAGHAMLEAWLTDPDEERHSYAHSAAAALPFVSEPPRGRLLALALDHPAGNVQLEAAWASAKIGSRAGIDFLARACLDPKTSAVAVAYLEELGELNAIPARAKNPDFAAVAEMCRWLAHPMEYGRPPDDAELYDARTLFWPPANEPRRLWLVKYRYRGANADGTDDVGVGMVGSVTFALFGEATADLPPEDVYALHCCWELEIENDPRAPERRSAAAGRDLLRGAGNAGF